MTRYRYKAHNAQGEPIAGDIDAAHADDAREQLRQRGLEVLELAAVATSAAVTTPLNAAEADELASHLVQLGESQFPLTAVLRAAADECGSRRVAAALRSIASRVERGESLEQIIEQTPHLFPPHIAGLVIAAAQTNQLGSALAELLEHQRTTRSLRNSIASSLAYPLLVCCLAVLLLLVALFGISDTYLSMFEEFELQLPIGTQLLFWWKNVGVWVMGLVILGLLAVAVGVRMIVGPAKWARLISTIPIFGPLWYWSGLAEWCSLLSVLVKHQIALPEALRFAAAGVRNADLSRLSQTLANRTASGAAVTDLLVECRGVPISLVPLVRWGERVGSLEEAFAAARELFERRARGRAMMLRSVLPPILFVVVACAILFVVGALFSPLVSLVTGLS